MEDQYQRIVTAEPGQIIYLGYQGENLARKIVFDVSAFQKTYPEGRIELLAQRKGDALPYPAARTILDGKHLIWILTDADTAKKEYGKCELCCHVNGKLAKTEVWTTFTMPALCTAAESPESSAQTQHLPKIGENRTWWIWDERSEAYIDSGIPVSSTANSLGELSDPAKRALLTLAQKVAYVDEHGQDYYNALYAALYPPAELLSISASFAQGSHVVYDTDSLDSLKPYLTVTALYNTSTTQTVTGYTLSGALTEGTSTVTVSYNGKTTTFNVTVTHKVTQVTDITAVFAQGSAVIYDNASLDDLKPYLVVTASYDDGTSAAVSGYTLSGTLAVGTSTITASYSGFSDTFTVTVTAHPAVLASITAVFTQGQNMVYDTDSLDTLKQYLVVTAHYDDNTDAAVNDYTLSGTLAEGTSTITASYGGKTDTFTVVVTQASREGIFGVFTNGITVVKAEYKCARKSVAARACAPIFIENKGYIFTVTDATKYSLAAYDVENDTPVGAPPGGGYVDSYGYAGGTKTVSWVTSDSVSTPYVWLALKKNDGTAFTEEELANGAEAVFTYTESGS